MIHQGYLSESLFNLDINLNKAAWFLFGGKDFVGDFEKKQLSLQFNVCQRLFGQFDKGVTNQRDRFMSVSISSSA